MKNVNIKVLEEKVTKAKTYQKDIDRNVTELARLVKDSKNSKLGNTLLSKSKELQIQADKEVKDLLDQTSRAKNPDTSFDETAKFLVDFQHSVDTLNTSKDKCANFINHTRSYSLTADNKEA